jgi:RNA polymerase sigma factor for flagellar operon FliA
LTPAQQADVSAFLPVAEAIARKRVRQLRAFHYLDDALSTAREAASEARSTFEPSAGTPFPVYAWRRVDGEVMDAIGKESRHWSAAREGALDAAENVEDPGSMVFSPDEEVLACTNALGDEVVMASLLRLSGEIRRTPGEAGAALQMSHARLLATVDGLVRRLDEEAQSLLSLRYAQDRSWKDVAADLGMPERTAKDHDRKIRRRLAALLRAAVAYTTPRSIASESSPPGR